MNPKKYKVYEHVNKVNGKRYIGQTGLCLSDRFQGGKGYSNQERFYNDILKYGWKHFEHNLIKDGLTKEESKKLERDLITKYETWNPDKGYNTWGSSSFLRKSSQPPAPQGADGYVNGPRFRPFERANLCNKCNPGYPCTAIARI